MDEEQKKRVSAVLSVVLSALVALLAAFGYQVVVVAPGQQSLARTVQAVSADVTEIRQVLSTADGYGSAGVPEGVCVCATPSP